MTKTSNSVSSLRENVISSAEENKSKIVSLTDAQVESIRKMVSAQKAVESKMDTIFRNYQDSVRTNSRFTLT